jgi:hypothetical protein
MGRKETVLNRCGNGIVEVEIVETADFVQLISGGIMIRTDKKTIEAGWGFIAKLNLNDGTTNAGTMRIPSECKNELWIKSSWKRTYESERDYS